MKPLSSHQVKTLKLLEAGGRIWSSGMRGFTIGSEFIAGSTVVKLRDRGLIERDPSLASPRGSYTITAAGRKEVAALALFGADA